MKNYSIIEYTDFVSRNWDMSLDVFEEISLNCFKSNILPYAMALLTKSSQLMTAFSKVLSVVSSVIFLKKKSSNCFLINNACYFQIIIKLL